MTHPELADTFESIAKNGWEGYYKGRIAQGQYPQAKFDVAEIKA